jgi:hypothetical protein
VKVSFPLMLIVLQVRINFVFSVNHVHVLACNRLF